MPGATLGSKPKLEAGQHDVRIVSIERAIHAKDGEVLETSDRYGRPVYEILVKNANGIARDWLTPGSSYKKTDEGWALSRWGKVVAAALDTERPDKSVAPSDLTGRLATVLIERDDAGRLRIVGWAPYRPTKPAEKTSIFDDGERRIKAAMHDLDETLA